MIARLCAVCIVLLFAVGCSSEPDGFVLTDANFHEKVLSSDQPVLVDFFATWCGACNEMAPVVAEVAGDFEGRAIVGKLDVDQNPTIADEYAISSLPTFILFHNGQIVDRIIGGTSKGTLSAMLDEAITQ